jgi:hypothetical protein
MTAFRDIASPQLARLLSFDRSVAGFDDSLGEWWIKGRVQKLLLT